MIQSIRWAGKFSVLLISVASKLPRRHRKGKTLNDGPRQANGLWFPVNDESINIILLWGLAPLLLEIHFW